MTAIEAIYQNGVFKPLAEVTLPENQRVTVVVAAPPAGRGVPAEQVRGIATGHGPPPDDETVRRWIEECRLQRAGL